MRAATALRSRQGSGKDGFLTEALDGRQHSGDVPVRTGADDIAGLWNLAEGLDLNCTDRLRGPQPQQEPAFTCDHGWSFGLGPFPATKIHLTEPPPGCYLRNAGVRARQVSRLSWGHAARSDNTGWSFFMQHVVPLQNCVMVRRNRATRQASWAGMRGVIRCPGRISGLAAGVFR